MSAKFQHLGTCHHSVNALDFNHGTYTENRYSDLLVCQSLFFFNGVSSYRYSKSPAEAAERVFRDGSAAPSALVVGLNTCLIQLTPQLGSA
jgi:hypothetical protein